MVSQRTRIPPSTMPRNTPRMRLGFTLFDLSGSFSGPELAMDDQKSIFMYLQPDGKLTPTRSYTSPVPEKHATVTLQWGSEADFDRLCGELRNSSPGS